MHMILNDNQIFDLISDGMILEICDPSVQVTPNGIDLTLKKIESFDTHGCVDFGNEQRKLPPSSSIPFIDSWVHVEQGAYKVTFNEIVSIPDTMIALARPRSSLLRSGASIESAVWDAGFHGISMSLLVVYNEHGLSLKKNARLMQMIFVKLDEKAHHLYDGIYQQK
jgi:dUTP pyrophosphatase